ncbi:MAG TPA: gamma-glutamyltransferase, partial [Candidatus Omnitrophota bacterium]|nr:gamma-glutamyltransferase [Candidatus Omnitrophota bacterium]
MSKSRSPSVGRPVSRLALAAVAAVGLAGCGIEKPVGTIGFVEGFGGVVAADEPRAVVVARDVLSSGGTAADAAVALYFTLAVTQPSTASLGGGGVCIVHSGDGKKVRTEVVDFLAPPSAAAGQARSPSAVPTAVRGLFAMHAKYGRLRWEQLLAEPERLARFGAPVSRAFAADLAKAAPVIARDPAARRIFFHPNGRVMGEGDELQQLDLAVTIGRIRRAPGDFYVGAGARGMIEAATQAGLSLTQEDLRDFRPAFRDTVTVKLGNEVAHFAPPPAVASDAAGTLTKAAVAKPEDRANILTQAVAQGQSAPAIMPGTGFVVLDSIGTAVVCGVSTQGVFGNGRVFPGTGIVAAAAPGVNGGPPAVAPMLLINPNVNEVRFGGTATGGGEAPAAVVSTLFAVYQDGRKLAEALDRPAAPNTPQSALAPTRVNAFYCDSGKASFKTCKVATDPRGFGLAAMVG